MPTSNLEAASTVLNHLWTLDPRPKSVLDVGAGHGKYSVLCREYVDPAMRMVAIEAIDEYVEDFHLRCFYDDVIVGDVLWQVPSTLNACDAVLMVDVIEHLEVESALALLSVITKPVVICTPVDFFQNPETHWSEVHRSHWTLKMFEEAGTVTRYSNVFGTHVVTWQNPSIQSTP